MQISMQTRGDIRHAMRRAMQRLESISRAHRVWELRHARHVMPVEVLDGIRLSGRERAGHDEGVVAHEGGQVGDRAVCVHRDGQVEVVARVSEAKRLAGLERAVDRDEVVMVVAAVDGGLVEDVAEEVAACGCVDVAVVDHPRRLVALP